MTVTLDHRPRLLLVDDEPTNLQVLRQVLQQEYRLQFATDGQRALELAREYTPDLILLDVMMPGMDGFEVARRLKALPATAHIPIIFMTGLTETEARKAGLRVKSAMATGTDRPGICPNPHRITIKLVYEANTRQVLGAQAWGEKNVSARINAIAVAIRAGMTVEALGQVDFVYSSSSCSIWDPVQIVCGQAQ